MNEATLSKSVYRNVFLALLVLLIVAVAVAFVPLGGFGLVAAMGIALVKAVLVVLYFMHVRFSSALVQVFILVSILWLLLLLGLTMNDYLTRSRDAEGTSWPPYPAQLDRQSP